MTFDSKTIQAIISYASIIMGVLTTQLQGVHLPVWGSAILGIFGILLHPDTSVTASAGTAKPVLELTGAKSNPQQVPSVPVPAQVVPTVPVQMG